MDKIETYRARGVFPWPSVYLFQILFLFTVGYSTYLWYQMKLYENISEIILLLLTTSIFAYVFSGIPSKIKISNNGFVPLIYQTPIEFLCRKYKWISYDDISKIKIYQKDGKTFRIDLMLKNDKKIYMYLLQFNPELAKIYEKIFRKKLEESAIIVIEKHSEGS